MEACLQAYDRYVTITAQAVCGFGVLSPAPASLKILYSDFGWGPAAS